MPKPDPAHKETDKILRDMEKRLDEVYKQAYCEARQTADDFMKQFREMDKKKRQQVKDGELDKAEYERWRRTQVFQGNRYHQMADTLAADMTNTNQIAASVINGYLPEVYAVNHNYGTYEIEKGSRINTQYTMYDKQTVERLIRDNPDLLPRKAAVNVPKDELWNKKHINSAVMQGIIQGDPIDKISQRLAATVTDMSHTSAIRNARTMTTSAQNGGRIDSYKRAESMGIKILQVWMATLDGRTRHEHRQLDGQKRKVGEAFEVEGEKIFFPGDPAAEPYLTYNCRCTLIGEVEGVDYNLSDVSQRDNKLGDMTYEEWKEEKRKQDNAEPTAPKKPEPPKNVPEGKAVEVDMPAPKAEKVEYVDEKITEKPKKAQGFTAAQKEAIEYYASGDGMYINNMLRGRAGVDESDLTEDDKQLIKDLDAALDKKVGKQTLYRSVDASAIFGNDVDMYDLLDEIKYQQFSNTSGDFSQKKAKEINAVIDKTIGKTILDKGYVSTTRSLEIAEEWEDFTGSENPIVMIINTAEDTKGANISNLTKYLTEIEADNPQEETLLARNQKYKILKIYAKKGVVYVDVQM